MLLKRNAGFAIIFLEPSDKMSDSMVLVVGHDLSLYSLPFFNKRFSLGFNKNRTWPSSNYDCIVILFYWLLKCKVLVSVINSKKYLILNLRKEPNLLFTSHVKS